MKARHKRLSFVVMGLVALGLITTLVMKALDNNLSYFYSPTEVTEDKVPDNHVFRLGGMVKTGSVQRGKELTVRFMVTDFANTVAVAYTGILPDLFQEGQGVIAQGKLNDQGEFIASEVLAKHDETYMPPEVADALEKGKKVAAEKPL